MVMCSGHTLGRGAHTHTTACIGPVSIVMGEAAAPTNLPQTSDALRRGDADDLPDAAVLTSGALRRFAAVLLAGYTMHHQPTGLTRCAVLTSGCTG